MAETDFTTKATFDSTHRLGYLYLTETPADAHAVRTVSAGPPNNRDAVLLDYAEDGTLIGIEFLNDTVIPKDLLAKFVSEANTTAAPH